MVGLLLIVLVSLAGILVLVADLSEGHTLTIPGAERTAIRKAGELSSRAPAGESVRYRLNGCKRAKTATGIPKPHTVDCSVTFDFLRKLKQSCRSVLRVEFRSEISRSTRVTYPVKPICEPL